MDFVFACGTDTFVNVDKVYSCLVDGKYNPNDGLYIGGHDLPQDINKRMYLYFHSGGAGYILSKQALLLLYPLFDTMMNDWAEYCRLHDKERFIAGCDLCISYYCHILNIQYITIDTGFYDCNYQGIIDVTRFNGFFSIHRCCDNKIKTNEIICCHNMSLRDFDDFTHILDQHNWFS
jgi:hypothetical protein